MNEDCQLLVLNHLKLPELATMAETSKYFLSLAVGVFKRKYSRKSIKIMGSFAIGSVKHIHYNDDSIELQDYETIPKVLRYFGHLIRRLQVEYYVVFDKEIKNINRNINLYCSDSLIEFDVHSGHEDFFDDMTKPFKNVKLLTIRGRFNSLDSKTLKMNELYPAMKRLILINVKVFNFDWIYLRHSNLEYLCVDVNQNADENMAAKYLSEGDVDTMIKSNPQIRTLRLGSITQNLLKLISKDLPALENLELEDYDEWNSNFEHRNILLPNVKFFKMERGSHSIPDNIAFPCLEVFESDGFPDYCTRWINFIENNKNLRKVRVYQHHIRNSELLRFARANLKLEEIALMCANNVEDGTIIKFMENSKNLRKIYLNKYIMPNTGSADNRSLSSTAENLRKQFSTEWMVHETPFQIFLERNV